MCTNCIFFNWTADIFILPSGRTQPMFLGLSDHLQWRFSRCSHHWTILWTYITWDNPIRFQQASSGVPGWPQCFQRRVCGYLVSGFLRYEVTRKMCSHLIIVWLQFFLILDLFFFSSGCGGVIHADLGSIKSPNYPQNFPSNIECSWTIVAHDGNHLEMNFASEFQIPDSSGHCQSSYIKVTIWKIFMQALHFH